MPNNNASSSTAAPQLLQTFGLFNVVMIVISSMIGSGVFKKVATMSDSLQSPKLVLTAWILGGIISLFGALGNAEVGGIIAEPGGQYAYFKQMYGKFAAFLYGWTCLAVIQTATAASVAYVFAESVNTLSPLPVLSEAWSHYTVLGLMPFANFGVKVLAMSLIGFFTFVNYRGVKYGGMINNVFAAALIIALAVVIVLNLLVGHGSWENFSHNATGYDKVVSTYSGFTGALFTAMLGAFWAYEGWNNIGFLGGEVKNAKRNIPIGLTAGVVIVMAIYCLINFSYLYVLPIEELIGIKHAQNQIAAVEVVKHYVGGIGVTLIVLLIAMANFNTTNNSLLTAPRITYAMARDGLFHSAVGRIHPRFNTPYLAIVIMGLWASVLVLSGTFDQLTDMLVFAAFIFYAAGAVGVFVLRRKMPDAPRMYRVPAFIPVVFTLFAAGLVVSSLFEKPAEAGIGLLLILAGIPVYLYFNRQAKV